MPPFYCTIWVLSKTRVSCTAQTTSPPNASSKVMRIISTYKRKGPEKKKPKKSKMAEKRSTPVWHQPQTPSLLAHNQREKPLGKHNLGPPTDILFESIHNVQMPLLQDHRLAL